MYDHCIIISRQTEIDRNSVGRLRRQNKFMELLVTRLSSVHECHEFSGISGPFGGLSVSSFCSAATIGQVF